MIHSHILASQHQVPFEDVPHEGCQNALEHSTKTASLGVLSQLRQLTGYAEELFGALLDEVQARDDKVRQAQEQLRSINQRIPAVERGAEGRKPWDFHANFEEDFGEDEEENYIHIFSQHNRPEDLQKRFELCEPPPDFSDLQKFAPLDKVTKQQVILDTKYSDVEFFFRELKDNYAKEAAKKRIKKRQRKASGGHVSRQQPPQQRSVGGGGTKSHVSRSTPSSPGSPGVHAPPVPQQQPQQQQLAAPPSPQQTQQHTSPPPSPHEQAQQQQHQHVAAPPVPPPVPQQQTQQHHQPAPPKPPKPPSVPQQQHQPAPPKPPKPPAVPQQQNTATPPAPPKPPPVPQQQATATNQVPAAPPVPPPVPVVANQATPTGAPPAPPMVPGGAGAAIPPPPPGGMIPPPPASAGGAGPPGPPPMMGPPVPLAVKPAPARAGGMGGGLLDAIRGFDKSKIKSRRKRAPKPQKKKLSLMDEIRAAKLKKGRKKVRRKAPAKEAEAKPNSVAALLDMRREEMGYDEDEEGGYQSSSSEWGSDDD